MCCQSRGRSPMNKKLREIMQRRLADVSETPCEFYCEETGNRLDFVFHINGQPLTYRQIQYHYNKALKKIGLYQKFSSTHLMRHSMANLVRERKGVESAQAVGRWKTRELVEDVYTNTPTHIVKDAIDDMELFLNGTDNNLQESVNCHSNLKLIKQ